MKTLYDKALVFAVIVLMSPLILIGTVLYALTKTFLVIKQSVDAFLGDDHSFSNAPW